MTDDKNNTEEKKEISIKNDTQYFKNTKPATGIKGKLFINVEEIPLSEREKNLIRRRKGEQ